MEKDYILTETKILDLNIKKIHYNYKIPDSNHKTRWIKIIVHHTGTKSKTIQDIINLHVKKNRWSEIGYHFLIGKTGKIYSSRNLTRAGAHTFGYNKNSIGIALFGNLDEKEPTEKQIESLKVLTKTLQEKYPIKTILGHNEAIYKSIKDKFWKLNLPEKNLLEIKNRNEFIEFSREITNKILEENSEKTTIDLIKRFKTCPGIKTYKIIKKLKEKVN